MRTHAGLRAPVAVFIAVATVISVFQADYINADFVAYSTVASRVTQAPSSSVTGSWSPLFSWLMVPLLKCGIQDLVAGRLILLISGLFYMAAIHRLVLRFFPPDALLNRLVIRALMACAVVQSVWFSTYLLNPDLLACALIFWYFVVLLDERTSRSSSRSLLAGSLLGMAYLAKAYMLPFGVTQLLVVTLASLVSKRIRSTSPQPIMGLRSSVAFLMGLGVIAGPWILVLTQKYERLTFTNAGRANHANVGPSCFGKDPLWHPPLTRDYILEPVIAEEWSPFASLENFRHQIRLVLHNGANCIGLIPGWLVMSGLALVFWNRRKQTGNDSSCSLAWWGILTAAVYCSGYLTVNLETRYIVPVVAPLLCLSAATLVRATVSEMTTENWQSWFDNATRAASVERRLSAAAVLLVLGFAIVDVYSIVCVPVYHPQSSCMAKYRAIARQLDEQGIEDQLSASNRWHEGLYIAYARGNVSNYMGSPQATGPSNAAEELISSGVRLTFQWNEDEIAAYPEEEPQVAGVWNRRVTIGDRSLGKETVEVLIR